MSNLVKGEKILKLFGFKKNLKKNLKKTDSEEEVSNLAKGEKILKLFGFNFFFSMLKLFILCICIMCILSYTPTHQCILSYTPTHQPSHFKDKHSKSPTIQVGCDNHYKCTNCDRWVSGKSRWTKICHIYLIRFLLTWVGVGLGLTLAQWCIAPPLSIVPQPPMRFLLTWVGFGDDSGSIVLQPPMRFISKPWLISEDWCMVLVFDKKTPQNAFNNTTSERMVGNCILLCLSLLQFKHFLIKFFS